MKKSLLIIGLLIILIPLQLSFLYLSNSLKHSGSVAGLTNYQSASVNNSVFIGGSRLNLFGYTSPQGIVTFEGLGIFEQTTANNDGYFVFDVRFSPLISREACLSSKDQLGRISSPVCLPPFPEGDDVNVGPVIIPPTLSLNNPPAGGDYFMGDEVILSGQAIPNTEVALSVFGDDKNFQVIKQVEAFTFPELLTQTDKEGNYSVNLPSSNPKKFRLFAQVNYNKSISANSTKLSLEILPFWIFIVRLFVSLLALIKPRLLEIAIISEIIFVLLMLLRHQNKAIVLYKNKLPIIKEESPLLQVDVLLK